MIKAFVDNSLFRRGRVVVALFNGEVEIDREMVLKSPFLLRIRCRLAARRIKARQRKLGKFNKAK